MAPLKDRLSRLGLALPDVLLPSPEVDIGRWAVIACDQFTSQPEYWEKVRNFVGSSPSTLEMILPEVYLGGEEVDERIEAAHSSMRRRLTDGTFRRLASTAVAVVRDTPNARGRSGLLIALDLEQYDFSAGSKSLVRATEQTIVDRLPPRVRVRTDAPLEFPHILVLLDDPDASVIEPTVEAARSGSPLYSTELMFGGGRVTGFPCNAELVERVFLPRLEAFGSPDKRSKRYGRADAPLFAMGDGNHSLASAKAVWEKLKEDGADIDKHPGRWALVEILNLHSPQLPFEPIHRVVEGATGPQLLDFAVRQFKATTERSGAFAETRTAVTDSTSSADGPAFGIGSSEAWHTVRVPSGGDTLTVAVVQSLLDGFCEANPHARLDFIHGSDALEQLSRNPDMVGVLLPPIDRSRLIPTVLNRGVLPRKAFSLGEAQEKRYYLEARRILPT